MAKVNRFGYEIRDADNKLVQSLGGFATRADAEESAQRRRDEIARRGWNMRVYVTEDHEVG